MQTVTITLGGTEYEVSELPSKRNAQWRRQLEEALTPVLDTLGNMDRIEIDNPRDVSNLIGNLRGVLFRSPETVTELLYAYSDTLKRDRQHIDDAAYDSELLAAFTQILRLAFPFGGLVRVLERLGESGSTQQPAPQT